MRNTNILKKNTHFGSFNHFSGYNCVISYLNVDNGRGYTFQQQEEPTKLKKLSWTGVKIAKKILYFKKKCNFSLFCDTISHASYTFGFCY